DGIRDKLVTGVQTCALPISSLVLERGALLRQLLHRPLVGAVGGEPQLAADLLILIVERQQRPAPQPRQHAEGRTPAHPYEIGVRSEERRVGKEWKTGGET